LALQPCIEYNLMYLTSYMKTYLKLLQFNRSQHEVDDKCSKFKIQNIIEVTFE